MQKKVVKEEQSYKIVMRHKENENHNGRCKSKHINESIWYEWLKQPNKMTEIVRLNFKNLTIYCLQETHFRFKLQIVEKDGKKYIA